jgi:hypothetical protein
MRNFDLSSGACVAGQSLAPASRSAASTTGSSVNFQNCDTEVAVISDVGAVTGTSTLTVTLQQSTVTGSGFTAISGFTAGPYTAPGVYIAMCISRQANFLQAIAALGGNSGSPVAVFGVILLAQLKIF